MAGEDLTSSEHAEPPRQPLPPEALRRPALEASADSVVDATWRLGLKSWFWGEGVCLLGMLRVAAARGQTPPDRVVDFVTGHAARGLPLEHVNNLAPGAAAALAALGTGRDDLRRVVVDCLTWLEGEARPGRAPGGALEHGPDGVWADTVFMAGSFLLHAGRLLERDDLVTEAVRQWLAHAEVLQHPESGLFAHGSHRGETIWSFWGRANAWTALAGVELCSLAQGVPGVDEVAQRVGTQLRELARLQPEHGVWDVLVDSQAENRGILETSAAAGIGAAMLRAGTVLPLDRADRDALRRSGALAVRGALAYLEDGVLTRVSAGTVLQLVPFGYSVIRDDRPQPWGQGLALEAIAAGLDAGEVPS
ncbi:MAG: glycoside hydrolase family 88 protein [Actinomycetota bacterium]